MLDACDFRPAMVVAANEELSLPARPLTPTLTLASPSCANVKENSYCSSTSGASLSLRGRAAQTGARSPRRCAEGEKRIDALHAPGRADLENQLVQDPLLDRVVDSWSAGVSVRRERRRQVCVGESHEELGELG
jgi:hypothetical protein